ncbi:uncharacterized protein BCR38DRAFT_410963 [Pseudomassariella vexata]|uniref:Uncharacterized protein n=1 Tax=Pseudomassariella vexata TaxID=1141098 RepID=A0A1Y2DTT6_9PEZI|nr:uncharacterized protein BCR38DRAFT_410963 [Pseudomassariella vexata]ORY62564.1 hypothetical protein BCR38DRAFT_410963 [Pseudomassariella vexata]
MKLRTKSNASPKYLRLTIRLNQHTATEIDLSTRQSYPCPLLEYLQQGNDWNSGTRAVGGFASASAPSGKRVGNSFQLQRKWRSWNSTTVVFAIKQGRGDDVCRYLVDGGSSSTALGSAPAVVDASMGSLQVCEVCGSTVPRAPTACRPSHTKPHNTEVVVQSQSTDHGAATMDLEPWTNGHPPYTAQVEQQQRQTLMGQKG